MSEVFEKPLKVKKARKPMSAEAKAKLVERLAAGRQRKKMKKLKDQEELKEFKKTENVEIKIEEKKVIVEPTIITKSEVPRVSVSEQSREIQKLRDELELQNLRNQLDDIKIKKNKKAKKAEKLAIIPEVVKPEIILPKPRVCPAPQPTYLPAKPIPIPLTKRQQILKQQSRYANFY